MDKGKEASSRIKSEILDMSPPQCIDMERAFLGSLILEPHVARQGVDMLQADDFFDHGHAIIFENLRAMVERQLPVDHSLLAARMKATGDWERAGGIDEFAKIVNSVPNAAHYKYYAQLISEAAVRRRVIIASTENLQAAYAGELRSVELIDSSVDRLVEAGDQNSFDIETPAQTFFGVGETMRRKVEGEQVGGGIPTGFDAYDYKFGGLFRKELSILAARPSMGKTALACNIAANVSYTGIGVMFVSLEMSRLELAQRVICAEAEVSFHQIRSGTAERSVADKITNAAARVAKTPLLIIDTPEMQLAQIRAAGRQIKRERGLGLIVVDYLQLIGISNEDRRKPRQEQIANLTKRLKRMSRDLDCHVMVLAQLNRSIESEKEKAPRMSHLRDTGAIEQDADAILFVHRPDYYEKQSTARLNEAQIIIGKNRNGPVGEADLLFDRQSLLFTDIAKEDEQGVLNYGDEF